MITLVGFLPQIVVSFFAGVWADRYNKKKLIMYSDGMIAISTLILAILFLCGYRQMWLLFVTAAIRSLGAGIQSPAISSFIPEIVPEKELMRVNGIYSTIQSIMSVISPVASGALLANVNLESIFFIDVFTAIIGIALVANIKYINVKKERQTNSHIDDLKEGITYLKNHKTIKKLLIFYAALAFLITPAAFLTTLMVIRSFGPEIWRLTLHETMFGVGAIIGGILVSIFGGFKNRIYTMAVSCIAFGLFSVCMGFSTIFYVYVFFMFLVGISMPFFNSVSIVYIQENVEQEMLRKSIWFCTDSWISGNATWHGFIWTNGRLCKN